MPVTTLLLWTVGLIMGSGVGYAFLSSRSFDRAHPEAATPEKPRP